MDNAQELQKVIKDLHNISGFRITVFDTEFNQIAAYPHELSPFCKLIRDNSSVEKICISEDIKAFNVAKETKKVYIYQCKFGLYEAVAPLYSFSVLIGYLMMGQILDTLNSSRSFVYNTASFYVNDKDKLKEAVSKIPIRSKEEIISCISIMNICAEYITLTNRLNSAQKDLAHEVKKYIDTNFNSKITIDSLCSRFFCSKATLINNFKKKYNTSINEYITKVRIENAVKLLTFTDKSIFEISNLSGFKDQNYFSKVFMRVQSKTPSQYRADKSNFSHNTI